MCGVRATSRGTSRKRAYFPSKSSSTCFSGSDQNGVVVVFQPATMQSSKVDALGLSFVVTGSRDKTIKLWDALHGTCLWTFVRISPCDSMLRRSVETHSHFSYFCLARTRRMGTRSRFSSLWQLHVFCGGRPHNANLGPSNGTMQATT